MASNSPDSALCVPTFFPKLGRWNMRHWVVGVLSLCFLSIVPVRSLAAQSVRRSWPWPSILGIFASEYAWKF